MKSLIIEKHIDVDVTYNGWDVQALLKQIADNIHDSVIAVSTYRQRNNIPEEDLYDIEIPLYETLDLLGD